MNASGPIDLSVSPTIDIAHIATPSTMVSTTNDQSSHGTPPPTSSEAPPTEPQRTTEAESEVDPAIIEALKGAKERLFVLKLGEDMEGLVRERTRGIRSRVDVFPSSTYQRLLVHRCAAYYKVFPETDNQTKGIGLTLTADSRIPSRRLADLVPIETGPQLTFKIMRRADGERPQSKSRANSTEDDSDEGTAATEGSSKGNKKRMTIAEREVAYNEARSRIFMGFEEKDKDPSGPPGASASTASLASSASSSARDDSSSVTSSEAPPSSNNKVRRTGGRSNTSRSNSTNSTRYIRDKPEQGNNAGFSYPSLYDPSAPYDPSAASSEGPLQGHRRPPGPHEQSAPYPPQMYPMYPPYPNHPYMTPYQYYPPPQQYAYPHPPPMIEIPPSSTPPYPPGSTPPNQPHYPHPSPVHAPQPHMQYPSGHPYPWPPPPGPQSPVHNVPVAHSPQQPPHPLPHSEHYQYGSIPFPAYGAPYPYPPGPHPSHYTTPPEQHHPHPGSPAQQHRQPIPRNAYPSSEPFYPRSASGPGSRSGSRNSNPRDSFSRGNNTSSTPPHPRMVWSYSSGSSSGPSSGSGIPMDRRRTSIGSTSGSVSGGSAGTRTPADETASTASSSTSSSSSRRTYTSTTSGKHPLPPRPDWAVGLTPSSRSGNRSQNTTPALKPADFPPLPTEKGVGQNRATGSGGAWGSPSATRSILLSSQSQVTEQSSGMNGNVGANYPAEGSTQQLPPLRFGLESSPLVAASQDSFERPPPKSNAELFNPRAPNRRASPNQPSSLNGSSASDLEREARARGEAVANAVLADKFETLNIEEATPGNAATIRENKATNKGQ